MRGLGVVFSQRAPDIDETTAASLPPIEQVRELSRLKASAVLRNPGEVALAADTLVALDEEVLGKPGSPEEAFSMLRRLSGRMHRVHTGLTLVSDRAVLTEHETTAVYFRALSDVEISRYISTGEPMDKAGAYGIQGLGALLVDRIDGDYYNVVGLPLTHLYKMLASIGESLL